MEIDRKELKRAARDNMRVARPGVMKVSFLYLLLASGVSLLISFVAANPAESIYRVAYAALNGADYEQIIAILGNTGGTWTLGVALLNALLFFYSIALSFGYTVYTLRRTDGETAGYGTLLSGFGQLVRVVVLELVVMVFTLAWTCLTMTPAVIAGVAVTMVLTIALPGSTAAMVLSLLFIYAVVIAAALVMLYLTGRYSLAPYILADHPEISGLEAVRRSRALLRSRLGEVFKLRLSFLGWGALGILLTLVVGGAVMVGVVAMYLSGQDPLLLGVGAYAMVILATLAEVLFQMWLLPYMEGTYAQYYRALLPKTVLRSDLDPDRPEPF